MATLQQCSSLQRITLQPHHVVGRAPGCHLVLSTDLVSSTHASLSWTPRGWVLRDLNSRNGTFVEGNWMVSGSQVLLRPGAKIAFGDISEEWQLLDAHAPEVMFVAVGGDCESVTCENGLLALPSQDQPILQAHATENGSWVLDRDGKETPLRDQQIVSIEGMSWRFCLPHASMATRTASTLPLRLGESQLLFRVSTNEEHVQLFLKNRGRSHDLGSRACFYLLLTLARRRLDDSTAGHTDAGWIGVDELKQMLRVDGTQLNVDVFRIRKSFAAEGVIDSTGIIERRADAGVLRIGISELSVEMV